MGNFFGLFPHIPKYSFVSWVCAHEKLPTLDKIKGWGIQLPNRCFLCKAEEESLNHLFFNCCFSKTIWRGTLERIGFYANESSWEGWLTWVSKTCKGKELKARIGRLAFCALIYIIWKERNKCLHEGLEATPIAIIQEVFHSIYCQSTSSMMDMISG